MGKVKVAIIGSRGIPARYGGFEIFAERLAQGLARRGYKVEVYCKSSLKSLPFNFQNVERVFLRCPSIRSLEKLCLSNQGVAKAILRGSDVLILLGVSGVPMSFLARAAGRKVILNPDGLEWKRRKWNSLGRWLLRRLEAWGAKVAHEMVADSEAIQDYLKETYGRASTFIPYGVDPPPRDQKAWEALSQRFSLRNFDYFLAVGRDVPENNFSLIVEGYIKAQCEKKLVIVSDLGETYRQFKGRKEVIFTGPIYKRNMLYSLRLHAFAHIHGHSVGGTNPSLLEAMACGNPVIAYDVVYNREVLGEAGLYFSNAGELAEKIRTLEREEERIRRKALEYYQRVLRKKYNWDVVVEAYAKLIEKIFAKG